MKTSRHRDYRRGIWFAIALLVGIAGIFRPPVADPFDYFYNGAVFFAIGWLFGARPSSRRDRD